ncbi:hypothetical protein BDF19DRAFT_173164 [Syncephalis fuscata]|nr:hypothetical protein BDF19DRAFT_173164 [Syncephalis fuscata]
MVCTRVVGCIDRKSTYRRKVNCSHCTHDACPSLRLALCCPFSPSLIHLFVHISTCMYCMHHGKAVPVSSINGECVCVCVTSHYRSVINSIFYYVRYTVI